jgi:hypothetical protein
MVSPSRTSTSEPSDKLTILCKAESFSDERTIESNLWLRSTMLATCTVAEGEIFLCTEKFHLIIVSALLSHEEKDCVISAAGIRLPLYWKSTFAPELLGEVEQRLLA